MYVRTPFTSVKTNGTPLKILTFQTFHTVDSHLSLSLYLSQRGEEAINLGGISCTYHAFIDVYLIARGASYPAPQKYDPSPGTKVVVVEPIIIPPGFEREREREMAAERAGYIVIIMKQG